MADLTDVISRSKLSNDDESGWNVVHKFGRNDSVSTSFVPVCNGGFYRTPTTATSLEVVSSSTDDSFSGSGAREVTITGLDDSWNEITQSVAMNGTTAVALPTDILRVYRWFISSSGTYATQSSGSHVGDITLRESGGGDVWSVIDATDFPRSQSQIGAYTVPMGKMAFVHSVFVDVDSARVANIIFFKRENANDTVVPYSGVMRAQVEFDGVSGSVSLSPKTPLGGFSQQTDIGFMARTTSGSAAISVDFEIVLQDI